MIRWAHLGAAAIAAVGVLAHGVPGYTLEPWRHMSLVTAVCVLLLAASIEVRRIAWINGSASIVAATAGMFVLQSMLVVLLRYDQYLSDPQPIGPSVITIAVLSLLGAAMIAWVLGRSRLARVSGVVAIIAGTLVLAGHLWGVPLLYGVIGPLAIPTATTTGLCFVLLGWSFLRGLR